MWNKPYLQRLTRGWKGSDPNVNQVRFKLVFQFETGSVKREF